MAMTRDTIEANSRETLRRVITFWPLLFYGLGVIIGAGIYVALGEVIIRAGSAAPLSFLIAGICAALTGICYAELAARYPDAAGAAAYVQKAFKSHIFGFSVGLATTIAAAVSAAAIAHGAIFYISDIIPIRDKIAFAILIVFFGLISGFGVKTSVFIAAIFGALELLGLITAFGMGIYRADIAKLTAIFDFETSSMKDIFAGAFIAFFAYVGFESLANMAEEVKDAQRVIPRAILTSVGVSVLIYCAVTVATLVGGASGQTPLSSLFKHQFAFIFSILAFFLIGNGTLVQITMLARLFYGMARLGGLPTSLGRVHHRTGTPLLATICATIMILFIGLAFNFSHLLAIVNYITLAIFISVNCALIKIHVSHDEKSPNFRAPRWVPFAAVSLSILMVASMRITD
jgi:APA family basic amino acid/polyamine antiporter